MFELLKVEKLIIFSKNLRVRIIRAPELIEDIRYAFFYRSGTHRVRSKTLRASDAERWCGGRGDLRQPIRCCLHLTGARAN